jgi:hypothetical protein
LLPLPLALFDRDGPEGGALYPSVIRASKSICCCGSSGGAIRLANDESVAWECSPGRPPREGPRGGGREIGGNCTTLSAIGSAWICLNLSSAWICLDLSTSQLRPDTLSEVCCLPWLPWYILLPSSYPSLGNSGNISGSGTFDQVGV